MAPARPSGARRGFRAGIAQLMAQRRHGACPVTNLVARTTVPSLWVAGAFRGTRPGTQMSLERHAPPLEASTAETPSRTLPPSRTTTTIVVPRMV